MDFYSGWGFNTAEKGKRTRGKGRVALRCTAPGQDSIDKVYLLGFAVGIVNESAGDLSPFSSSFPLINDSNHIPSLVPFFLFFFPDNRFVLYSSVSPFYRTLIHSITIFLPPPPGFSFQISNLGKILGKGKKKFKFAKSSQIFRKRKNEKDIPPASSIINKISSFNKTTIKQKFQNLADDISHAYNELY